MKGNFTYKAIFLLVVCASFILSLKAQYFEQADSAFAKAKTEGKPVLIVFSGSDWCVNCKRFDKEVMHDPVFVDFASKHLIVLIADFPQRKKQTSLLIKQNEGLAERYDADGKFPAIVAVDADEPEQSKALAYVNQSALEFIDEIKRQLPYLGYYE